MPRYLPPLQVWEGDYPGDQLTIADHAFHGYVRVRCWNIANQARAR